MTTRMQLLKKHDNDYGFNPTDISPSLPHDATLSVIVPYYNTGHVFERFLHFLSMAINKAGRSVEVVIVDDGSTVLKACDFIKSSIIRIKLVEHDVNRGRTEARNTGLEHAIGELVLFLDSDVMVDEQLIINHLALHGAAAKQNKKSIVVSFFEFTDKYDERIERDRLTSEDLRINDFRIECTYGPTWIGCEDDKVFIGQHMKIVNETHGFRQWKGQYKAWMLPNMILGGAFSVYKTEINAIGNFDTRFKGYGFTETSAVTRMVAELGNVVIPSLNGGALHVEDELTNVPRAKKDKIFKQKHDFYFNTFLQEEVNV